MKEKGKPLPSGWEIQNVKQSRNGFYSSYSDEGLELGIKNLEKLPYSDSKMVQDEIKKIKNEIQYRQLEHEKQRREHVKKQKQFPQKKWGI